ncbi:hypothetical protein OXX80_001097 [Metschnikowia pulcherrima]
MNLLTFIPLLSLAFAYDTLRPGAMYISKLVGIPSHQGLEAEETRVLASRKRTSFHYDANGSLKLADEDKYLSITEEGKLVLANTPHFGFELKAIDGLTTMRSMNYNGTNLFELCGDNSVGFRSKCEGAERAVITFEDILSQ